MQWPTISLEGRYWNQCRKSLRGRELKKKRTRVTASPPRSNRPPKSFQRAANLTYRPISVGLPSLIVKENTL